MDNDSGRSPRDGLSPSVEPASSLAGSAASIPSAEVLPSDGNILRHRRFGGEFKPDMSRCRCRVSYKVGRSYDARQCAKPVKVTRMVDGPKGPEPIGYCGTHDPLAVAKRHEVTSQRWKREAEERRQRYSQEAYVLQSQPVYFDALVKIAQGANDARAIATAALARFDAFTASAMSARQGQDPQGLGAQPASAVGDSRDDRTSVAPTDPEAHP